MIYYLTVWFEHIRTLCQGTLAMVKHSFFDGYFMSFGIFDREIQNFIMFYRYDKLLSFVYIMLSSLIIPKQRFLLSTRVMDALTKDSDRYITVGCFYDDKRVLHCMINNHISKSHNLSPKFVYCILNDEIDMTHSFECFKSALAQNKSLKTKEIVGILSYYSGHRIGHKVETLKILSDDHFNEKTFKPDDCLEL